MTKVTVSLVIYESVEIEVPQGYPENIDSFSFEQMEFVKDQAKEKIWNQTGMNWEIENVEVSDD